MLFLIGLFLGNKKQIEFIRMILTCSMVHAWHLLEETMKNITVR